MNANPKLSIRCDEYAHQTVSFLKRSTRSSAVVFTWYEPGAEYPPHIQLGADERMIREYYELYYHKDPMRAEVLIRDEKTVETFENAVRSCDQNLLEQYRPFLRKHSVVDEIDFVLWAGGNAVGSVALLFHQSDTLSVSKENLAGMQSYLQYAFSLMPAVRALELKSILQDTYGLTTKEREVAELMIMGESNKSIASMLGVELATVKTHLVHTFQKMEVKSRSKAIALLAAE